MIGVEGGGEGADFLERAGLGVSMETLAGLVGLALSVTSSGVRFGPRTRFRASIDGFAGFVGSTTTASVSAFLPRTRFAVSLGSDAGSGAARVPRWALLTRLKSLVASSIAAETSHRYRQRTLRMDAQTSARLSCAAS